MAHQIVEGYQVLKPNPNKIKDRQEKTERMIRNYQRELRESLRITETTKVTK